MGTIFWLVLFIIFLIAEIGTMGLTTIWFAGGALVACIMAYFEISVIAQIFVFLLVSIGLLILTRPIAMKYFNQKRQKTNADRLIGQKAVVFEQIDTLRGVGKVKVNGMEWSAKTVDPNGVIESGAIVVIENIQGVKLVVKHEEV